MFPRIPFPGCSQLRLATKEFLLAVWRAAGKCSHSVAHTHHDLAHWHEVHTCCTSPDLPFSFSDNHGKAYVFGSVTQDPGFCRTHPTIRDNKSSPLLWRVLLGFQLLLAVPPFPPIFPFCLPPISGSVISALQRLPQWIKPGLYNKCS